MERIYIKDVHSHVDKEITVAGWVDVRRDHGKLIFIDLRDRTGVLQCASFALNKEVHGITETLRSEWVIEITGKIKKRPEKMINHEVETGDVELEITDITVLNEAKELPFEKDTELNVDVYLDHLPLTLKSKRARDIFTVQATLVDAFRKALQKKEFIEFQAPGIVGEDAEGGAEAFKVDYFYDRSAFLATSPQLYKQIMVGAFERVHATPKVFRGEKHSTTRHLNEYSTLDYEMGFIKDHHDVMNVLQDIMKECVTSILEKHKDILARFKVEVPLLPDSIPVMKLKEAQEIIKKETEEDLTNEPDLDPSSERFMSEYALKKFNSDFLFITHYPSSKRPFYTYEDEEDKEYTKSFDLLFRGVEITTGGQRIHNYDELVEKMKARGLDPEKFSFYLEAFASGMPPHGGSATGLERLTQKVLGLLNVKEAALFPREINRIDTLLSQE